MKEAMFLVLLSILFISPTMIMNPFSPVLLPPSPSDTVAPASSAPDCRIQTC